jgi:F-type H+-transporting ATPase subunit delta
MLSTYAKNQIRRVIAEYAPSYSEDSQRSARIGRELCLAAEVITDSNSLARLLTSASADLQDKHQVLDDIFGQTFDVISVDIIKKMALVAWVDIENLAYAMERVSLDAYMANAELSDSFQQTADQILHFYQLILHNHALRNFFSSDEFPIAAKQEFLASLLGSELLPAALGMLNIAIESHRRVRFLMSLRWIMGKMAKRKAVTIANLNTSFAISDSQSRALQDILEAKLEQKVQLNIIFDRSDFGKLRLDLASTVIDGSLGRKIKVLESGIR